MAQAVAISRAASAQRGRRLEYFSIVWNTVEGLVGVAAGALAGSISLVGFGIDSFIEVASGAALLWRMSVDSDTHSREHSERRALRMVGLCFIALAIFVTYESAVDLLRKQVPQPSAPGMILAGASLAVMPLLARAKRNVAAGLQSAAMRADAQQTELCANLSAILLGGLALNAWLGLWWADPVAALIMVPIIAKEGIESLRGKDCQDGCHT